MLHLKRAYVTVFPLTSLRRFIVDQVLTWLYYATLIIGITVITLGPILSIFYAIGLFCVNYFGIKSKIYIVDYVFLGFGIFTVVFLFIIIIVVIIMNMYWSDYLPWLKEQTDYITELDIGKPDIEAEFIPVNTNIFQVYSYKICPLGSIFRYFTRVLIFIIIFLTIIVVHGYLSIITFPIEGYPWPIKWLWSILFQIFVLPIICGICYLIISSCVEKWNIFVMQKESMIAKKN